jgi:hypothetical protein
MADGTTIEEQRAGLNEVERVVDVFVAPSKTFIDILRNTSWWLPFILMLLVTVGSTVAVDKQVGFTRVAENQMQERPRQAEQYNNLPADQKAAQLENIAKIYRVTSYGSFVLILTFVAIGALLYWATFNFGLGARTTFQQMFAVWMYASLPRLFTGLLSIGLLMAGVNTEGYNMQNPVGTNLAYYLPDSPLWLRPLLSFFDVIGLWVVALLILGTAIVAKVPRAKAATVVLGWWLLGLIVMTAVAAANS